MEKILDKRRSMQVTKEPLYTDAIVRDLLVFYLNFQEPHSSSSDLNQLVAAIKRKTAMANNKSGKRFKVQK